MSAAVAAILEGMPEPRDLRVHEHDGPADAPGKARRLNECSRPGVD